MTLFTLLLDIAILNLNVKSKLLMPFEMNALMTNVNLIDWVNFVIIVLPNLKFAPPRAKFSIHQHQLPKNHIP